MTNSYTVSCVIVRSVYKSIKHIVSEKKYDFYFAHIDFNKIHVMYLNEYPPDTSEKSPQH